MDLRPLRRERRGMTPDLRAITVWQPHASLIAIGAKTIETRSWATKYRGPVLIHAAKRKPWVSDRHGWIGRYQLGRWCEHMEHVQECECDEESFLDPRCESEAVFAPALLNDEGAHGWSLATYLPLGAVVAVAELVDCVPIHEQGCHCEVSGLHVLRGVGGLGREVIGLFQPDGRGVCYVNGNQHEHPWAESQGFRDMTEDLPFGDYPCDRYAWLLDAIRPIDPPIPAKGRQGLWTPDEELRRQVGEAAAEGVTA